MKRRTLLQWLMAAPVAGAAIAKAVEKEADGPSFEHAIEFPQPSGFGDGFGKIFPSYCWWWDTDDTCSIVIDGKVQQDLPRWKKPKHEATVEIDLDGTISWCLDGKLCHRLFPNGNTFTNVGWGATL